MPFQIKEERVIEREKKGREYIKDIQRKKRKQTYLSHVDKQESKYFNLAWK